MKSRVLHRRASLFSVSVLAVGLLALPAAGQEAAPHIANAFQHLDEVMDRYHRSFDVYTDLGAAGNHFAARCAMGTDSRAASVATFDESWSEGCREGATCIRNEFHPPAVGYWAGWYFQNGVLLSGDAQPRCNWGTYRNAGFDLSGATRLTFWAKGEVGGEKIDLFAGGVGWNPERGTRLAGAIGDSFSRAPGFGHTFTLTNTWQQYEIDLTGMDLSYVNGGFAWVASGDKNPPAAGPTVFYLDDIKYELARTDALRLIASYQTIPIPPGLEEFDPIFRNVAFTYDNVVVLLAYLAQATHPDSLDEQQANALRRAGLLADAFVYAQNHDRAYSDGRLRNAYQAGDLVLPPGWQPNGRIGTARMPGWWDTVLARWLEDEAHVGSDTGNMAWVVLGLTRAYQVLQRPEYLAAAQRLGAWIFDHTWNGLGPGGYTGGYEGWEPDAVACEGTTCDVTPRRRTWKSTEHNLDLFAAFMALADATSEPEKTSWRVRAYHARDFVRRMWEACGPPRFAAGTRDETTNNCIPPGENGYLAPADVNTWGVMVLGDRYSAGVQWVQENAAASDACFADSDEEVPGIDFNDDRDGVWLEGTAHTIIAQRILGRHGDADTFLNTLRRVQQSGRRGNGKGIVAACKPHTGISTGLPAFSLYNRLHIAATAWYAMAELQHNPYWGIGTADAIPHPSGTPPAVLSIAPGEGEPGTILGNVAVTGAGLADATFTFVQPAAAGNVTAGIESSDASGESATLSVTIDPAARDRFVLVAVTASESSDARPTNANTFNVRFRCLPIDEPIAGDIGVAGGLDTYCLSVSTPTRVVLKATTGGIIQPRLAVRADKAAAGTYVAATWSYSAARLELVLAPGTYFAEVSDAYNDQTGSYTLTYVPLHAAATTAARPNDVVGDALNPRGDLDVYSFTLQAPTRVVLQATAVSGIQPHLRLMTGAGGPAVTGTTVHWSYTAARLALTLSAGTYFVEVSDAYDDASGDYTFVYEPLQSSTTDAVTANEPVSGTLMPRGDLDLFMFTLTEPARVVLQASAVTGIQPALRLMTGSGGPAVTGTAVHWSYTAARLDLTLAPGTYFVEVGDAYDDAAGAYTLIYQPLHVSTTDVVVANEPVSGSLTPRGDLDLFTFTLTEPTRVVLQAAAVTGIQPMLRLLSGVGTPAVTGPTVHWSYTAARLDLTLAAGTYFVEVGDAYDDAAGTYTFIYEPLQVSTTDAAAANAPVSGALNPRGELDLFTFTLTEPTRVVLQAAAVTGIQPMLRLLTGVGTPAVTGLTVHWSYTAARLDLTLAPGTYFVEVGDAYDDAAGTYMFIYEPLQVSTTDAALAGAPVNGMLNPRGELDLFAFSLAEPTRVVLTAAAVSGIQPMLRLMAGAGAPAIAGPTVHWSYTVARLDLTLQPGTYYVEVSDAYDDGAGGYTFSYQPAPVVTTAGGAACCLGPPPGGSLTSDALAASLLARRALLERLQVLHDPADLSPDRLRIVVLFRARERVAPDRHVAAVRHGRIAAVNRLRHVVCREHALVLLGELRQV